MLLFKNYLVSALLLISYTTLLQNKLINEKVINPITPAKYKLIWSDEFNGEKLDPKKWAVETGYGLWGNAEQENYQTENVKVSEGQLHLTAKKELTKQSNYTSGRVVTLGKYQFTYGKVEARIKVPRSKGLWPAFWMLGANMRTRENKNGIPWPACGEIDIMETINSESWVSGALHWATDENTHIVKSKKTTTSHNDYHLYSVEWTKEAIKWYLDGQFYHEVAIKDGQESTSEMHLPFYLILNLAVGGDWPGQVIDDHHLPATMLVDYVRVYKELE